MRVAPGAERGIGDRDADREAVFRAAFLLDDRGIEIIAPVVAFDHLSGIGAAGFRPGEYRLGPHDRRIMPPLPRSEEHTSELQSLMRNSYAVFCLKKKNKKNRTHNTHNSMQLHDHCSHTKRWSKSKIQKTR